MNEKATLLRYLRQIRDQGPPLPSSGICGNLLRLNGNDPGSGTFAYFCAFREEMYQAWPKFSGNLSFPVPTIMRKGDPSLAYSRAEENMWKGAYGNHRRDLLNHLIAYLEAPSERNLR